MTDEKSKTPASDGWLEKRTKALISMSESESLVLAQLEQAKRLADAAEERNGFLERIVESLERISVDYSSIESSLAAVTKLDLGDEVDPGAI